MGETKRFGSQKRDNDAFRNVSGVCEILLGKMPSDVHETLSGTVSLTQDEFETHRRSRHSREQ